MPENKSTHERVIHCLPFSEINLHDAFNEYYDNPTFRDVVNSGLFAYVEGCFAIDDKKYVLPHPGGDPSLTDHARDNRDESTLQFTYRDVNIQEHGRSHPDDFHKTSPNALKKLPRFDATRSITAISNAEELRQKREEFEAQFAEHMTMTKTFWQRAFEIMQARHWNSHIFCEKTTLNEMTYSRAKNNNKSLPDIRTVMAICVGLDLDMQMTNELLALAGHTLSNSREHQAYGFIITAYKGKSIHERNEFLQSLGIQPLGSKQRL